MSLMSHVASALSRISSFIMSHVSNPMDMVVIHNDRRKCSTSSKERNDDGTYGDILRNIHKYTSSFIH